MAEDEAQPPDFDDTREVRSLSPEARRRHALEEDEHSDVQHLIAGDMVQPGWRQWFVPPLGMKPGSRPFEIVKRAAVGTWNDGFIHAGNLAYLSLLAIFPFFIFSGFVLEFIGGLEDPQLMIETVLVAMPPTVQEVIEPVALSAIEARSGWLLWLGAGVGLWTVSSLIESIRDILRRAYGTNARYAFWRYRLVSTGLIIGAVVVLLLSLYAQVLIEGSMQVIDKRLPGFADVISTLQVTRIIPALGLFGSLFVLFFTLTPREYRQPRYPKWPGALFTALWWVGVTMALPPVLHAFFTYDLTYGSLAGIMIALFFFWLVGLGLVIGAELNAALTEPESGAGDVDTTGAAAL